MAQVEKWVQMVVLVFYWTLPEFGTGQQLGFPFSNLGNPFGGGSPFSLFNPLGSQQKQVPGQAPIGQTVPQGQYGVGQQYPGTPGVPTPTTYGSNPYASQIPNNQYNINRPGSQNMGQYPYQGQNGQGLYNPQNQQVNGQQQQPQNSYNNNHYQQPASIGNNGQWNRNPEGYSQQPGPNHNQHGNNVPHGHNSAYPQHQENPSDPYYSPGNQNGNAPSAYKPNEQQSGSEYSRQPQPPYGNSAPANNANTPNTYPSTQEQPFDDGQYGPEKYGTRPQTQVLPILPSSVDPYKDTTNDGQGSFNNRPGNNPYNANRNDRPPPPQPQPQRYDNGNDYVNPRPRPPPSNEGIRNPEVPDYDPSRRPVGNDQRPTKKKPAWVFVNEDGVE